MDVGETKTEIQEISARLDTIKAKLKTYPTPIAGCDPQFNVLLAERIRLREMIERL